MVQKKNKRKIISNKHNFDKNNEIKYLKIIKRLPEDVVKNIINYLDVNVFNIIGLIPCLISFKKQGIKPINNVCSLHSFTSDCFWLNYYVSFWIKFNHKNDDRKNNIKKLFYKLKSCKYLIYNGKIYDKNCNKLKKILKKFVEKDVERFSIEERNERANERLTIKYADNIILDIINSKC